MKDEKTKILWISNLIFPVVADYLKIPIDHAGGWLIGASNVLKNNMDSDLYIMACYSRTDKIINVKIDGINYIIIPNKDYKSNFEMVNSQIHPDVIHVFGTEMPHSWHVLDVFDSKKVVFSIQGIVSECALYYYSDLPQKIIKRKRIYELLTRDGIEHQQKSFVDRGRYEVDTLRKAKHVIGRTEWDKAIVKILNPQIKYHSCNETLRDVFYDEQWNIKDIEKFSLFISQGSSPLKGLHFAINAMADLKKEFPNIRLFISGDNILKNKHKQWKMSSYSKYIYDLLKQYNLEENVIFLGTLNPEEMKNRYLKSHIYLCTSSIENSPNSLAEAMMLGVPCIASWVGGIPSMLEHGKEGFLYQYNSSKMLAYYIKQIFINDDVARKFSYKSRERALRDHNPKENNDSLLQIYKNILGEV